MSPERRYTAFISYSHRDRAWGDWLHHALESYRVPRRIIGMPGRDGPVPARLYPVFRDREELPTSADLGTQIEDALERSAVLIVICSPAAAQSRWVGEEIRSFRRRGRNDRILALIAGGTPNAAAPEDECFPPALTHRLADDGIDAGELIEPLAADARPQGDGRAAALLKVVAGVLGVPYETLRQRELEAARRRARVAQAIAAAMVLLALMALGAGAIAWDASENAAARLADAQRAQSLAVLERVQSAPPHVAVPALLAALPRDLAHPDRPLVRQVAAQLALSLGQWAERSRISVQPSEQMGGIQIAGNAPVMMGFTHDFPSTIATYRLQDGMPLHKWRSPGRVMDAAISDDGAWVAAALNDRVPSLVMHDAAGATPDRSFWLAEPASASRLLRVAVAAEDGAAVISYQGSDGSDWLAAIDPATGAILDAQPASTEGDTAGVWLDPKGRYALVFLADNRIIAWRIGRVLRQVGPLAGRTGEFDPFNGPAPRASLSPDGAVLAIDAGLDGDVSFHAMTDGHRLGGGKLPNGRLAGFGFAGPELLAIDRNGVVTVGDAAGMTQRFRWQAQPRSYETLLGASWAGDGARIVLLLSSGALELWDWRANRLIARKPPVADETPIRGAAYTGNGSGLLLGRADGSVTHLSLTDLGVLGSWQTDDTVRAINSSAGDGAVILRRQDGMVCTLDIGRTDPPSCRDAKPGQLIWGWAGTGDLLALDPDRGILEVTDPHGTLRRRLTRPRQDTQDLVRFDHAGKRLATLSSNAHVEVDVFDIATKAVVWRSAPTPDPSGKAIAFDPTDRFLAALTQSGVRVYDLAGGPDPVWSLADTNLESIVFTPEALLIGRELGGTEAYAVSANGTWQKVPRLSFSKEIGRVLAADRSGATVVTQRSPDGAFGVVSAETGQPLSVFPPLFAMNQAVALSPDGAMVALLNVLDVTGNIVLREAKEARPSVRIEGEGERAGVVAAVFLPDGRLASATADGRVVVTLAASGEGSEIVCGCGEISGLFTNLAGTHLLVVGRTAAVMFETTPLTEHGRLKLGDGEASAWPRADADLRWLVQDVPPGGVAIELADPLAESVRHKVSEIFGLVLTATEQLDLARDGSRIVYLYNDAAYWLAPDAAPRSARKVPMGQPARVFAVDRTGRRLAAWLGDNHLKLFDLDRGVALFDLPDIGQIASLGFAGADDTLLWVRRFDGVTVVLDAATGRVRGALTTPANQPVALEAVVAAGDGRIAGLLTEVESGTDRGKLMVWQTSDLLPIGVMPVPRPGHQLPIMAFPGSGPRLIASADGSQVFAFRDGRMAARVAIADPDYQTVIDAACRRIDRPLNAAERASYFLTGASSSGLGPWLERVAGPLWRSLRPPPPAMPCGRAALAP